MKKITFILILSLLSCEETVLIELPDEQNLIVVEGSVTDALVNQSIKLTRSNSFSGQINPNIEDASVMVEDNIGNSFSYQHTERGTYLSNDPYQGIRGNEYRVIITLANGDLIQSEWSVMPPNTRIVLLSVDSFEENDPLQPNQDVTIFFPRITARDSAEFPNYYRWIFYKNGVRLTEPESITIQNDLFFDGNFIPNLFDEFEYLEGEEMTVELLAINRSTFDFLELLKAQITTLGSSVRTTPANVSGNLTNLTNPSFVVLGHFSALSVSTESTIAEN